ncbi:hypothetical protein [Bacillus sp. B1-b2]|uniref:hypothetical protein n=1 Tax=Bacillus sp. B1-b2 TaxID=2653201 RepID=UPI001261ED30|nr:hypothetical protein [Bacillus sp. B1-b2]KAB7666472.1 hypothetical protein F9279_17655 [Bacillus sp. B1-b2]
MAQVTIDFYELLKKGGNLLQYRINDSIKKNLNQIPLVDFAKSKTGLLTKRMDQIQQYTEQATNYMNLPTKTDIANTTQLILQSEEKIDQLDNQLYSITSMLTEMKEMMGSFHQQPSMSFELNAKITEQEELIVSLQRELVQAKELLQTQMELVTVSNPTSYQAM